MSHDSQGTAGGPPSLPPRAVSAQSVSVTEEIPPPELDFAIPVSSVLHSPPTASKPPPLPPRGSVSTVAPPPLPERKTQSRELPINTTESSIPAQPARTDAYQQSVAPSQPPNLPLRPAVGQNAGLLPKNQNLPTLINPPGPALAIIAATPKGSNPTHPNPTQNPPQARQTVIRGPTSPQNGPSIQIQDIDDIKPPTQLEDDSDSIRPIVSTAPQSDKESPKLPPPALPKRDRRPSAPSEIVVPSQLPPNPIPRMSTLFSSGCGSTMVLL